MGTGAVTVYSRVKITILDSIHCSLTAANAVVVPPNSEIVLMNDSVWIVVVLTTTSVMLADTAPGMA